MPEEVRGQLSRVGSLLPPRESQRSNPGFQARLQAPLPTESSHQPHFFVLKVYWQTFLGLIYKKKKTKSLIENQTE